SHCDKNPSRHSISRYVRAALWGAPSCHVATAPTPMTGHPAGCMTTSRRRRAGYRRRTGPVALRDVPPALEPLTQPTSCYSIATVQLLLGGVMGFPDRIERTRELPHRSHALQLPRWEGGSQGERLPGQSTIPAGHEMEGYSSMSTKEETTATTVRALNDALNARDRAATVAL